MRTTLRLDDELLARAKQLALARGRSLTAILEEALRDLLHRQSATVPTPLDLPTYGTGGTLPGVDLDDSAALIDLMDAGASP